MSDTSELLGAEVLAMEILGFGGLYYSDADMQVNSQATAGVAAAMVRPCAFASSAVAFVGLYSVKLRPCMLASNASALTNLPGARVKQSELDVYGPKAVADWKPQKFCAASMDSLGVPEVIFLRPIQIILSEISERSRSSSRIESIGLVDYIDTTDGLARPAELRTMARGSRDSDMHVFAHPGMTREAEERDMVAP